MWFVVLVKACATKRQSPELWPFFLPSLGEPGKSGLLCWGVGEKNKRNWKEEETMDPQVDVSAQKGVVKWRSCSSGQRHKVDGCEEA